MISHVYALRHMSPKLTQTKLVRLEEDLNILLVGESKQRRVSVAFIIREALRERYKDQLADLAEVTTLMGSQMPIVAPEPSQGPSEGGTTS